VDDPAIGRQLRARRTAAGRTVASVAADAGLSVPYIANRENGRGNPTTTALTRLAEALGMKLVVTLIPGEQGARAGAVGTAGTAASSGTAASPGAAAASGAAGAPAVPAIPASLVRLGRTDRFRRVVAVMAATLDTDAEEFSSRLLGALATVAEAMGRDLGEADWWRLVDALLLIAAHPAAP
jgi:transcriptional regulator with XRE-family HTH domain